MIFRITEIILLFSKYIGQSNFMCLKTVLLTQYGKSNSNIIFSLKRIIIFQIIS